MRYVNGTRLDDRIVRTDWDAGFKEGRQYGRGKTGGQVSYISANCKLQNTLQGFFLDIIKETEKIQFFTYSSR